jgi:cleavage and polyadenylation specificity factor subunit 3
MTGFRGRIFATHATIAVMRLLLQDFVRVAASATASADDRENPGGLYDAADVSACLARMEPLDLHQRVDVGGGATLTLFAAGHVLGAAMALLDIGGVRLLYTGDYSCEEDRHLEAAEVPPGAPPDVLIVESTYGLQVHEARETREKRFVDAVERIVRRGGRCLIPAFALGRAQELLLLLEELWAQKPELQGIPIFHASDMAERALDVYRTYIGAMNKRVQRAVGGGGAGNPWNFRFVRKITRAQFVDAGPCVVLAAPGMLQSGFSRALFDRWAEDARNGVVLAGYSTEGTLARQLEANPTEVESAGRRKLTRRLAIERVSFSAHADGAQTARFVDALRPRAVVLVHGERNEMRRLHAALGARYAGGDEWRGAFMPSNNQAIALDFAETKVARLMGALADAALAPRGGGGGGARLPRALLVSRNFETMLVAPADVARFSQLSAHAAAQALHVPFRASFRLLADFARALFADTEEGVEAAGAAPPGREGRAPRATLRVARGLVRVTHAPPDRVVIAWDASPAADMVAEALVTIISQVGVSRATLAATTRACAHAGGAGGAHAHAHDAACGGGGDAAGDEAADAAWAAAEPWARAVLASDSGPRGAAPAAAARAAALAELLAEQYGAGAVVRAPPGDAAEDGGFALDVALDGRVARVAWEGGAAGATRRDARVSAQLVSGARDADTEKWLAALAATAELVDDVAAPLCG